MQTQNKGSLMLVDDNFYVRDSVSLMLTECGYDVSACENAEVALTKIKDKSFDLILTDIKMPGMSGTQFLQEVRQFNEKIPVILMTAYADVDMAISAVKSGAFDFVIKPFNPDYLKGKIKDAIYDQQIVEMEKRYTKKLEGAVRERTSELTRALDRIDNLNKELIVHLTSVAEFRDSDTGIHISRIGFYVKKLAQYLQMPEDFVDVITSASALHDIGKIGIRDDILLKPGPLTSEEFETLKMHTIVGSAMLSGSDHPFIKMAQSIAQSHHERWDGSGYPAGLDSEDIPIEARIVIICDQYDALRSKRPYKQLLSHEQVFQILTEGDGRTLPSHFDPQILSAFKALASEFEKIYETHLS